MKRYKERGRRAQRLASTRMLAGTLHSAASSDPKSDSFSTHPQSGEGWVEKLVQDTARNQNAVSKLWIRIRCAKRNQTQGVGQI